MYQFEQDDRFVQVMSEMGFDFFEPNHFQSEDDKIRINVFPDYNIEIWVLIGPREKECRFKGIAYNVTEIIYLLERCTHFRFEGKKYERV